MIWYWDEIIPDDALSVSVLDRTFEHGLGLFETFRTWNGHPSLLNRNLQRMQDSARELGLPLEPDRLPDDRAVLGLLEASGFSPGQDARLRITLSGGRAAAVESLTDYSVLWMTAGPLPPPISHSGAIITRSLMVAPADSLARHKTLNYWRMRIASSQGLDEGSDEVLCLTADGLVWEATRSNIFLVRGRRLLTPGPDGPFLPGIMRRVVIDQARSMGLSVVEKPLPQERLSSAGEAFLTNSVWGMLPIARLMGAELPAPGPVTAELWQDIRSWLESGGPAR
jgi:branched-subunit amino acid aminotransferase/4-amino-4-deoxychorismate lyase